MPQAAGQFRDCILGDIAEDRHVEHRHRIGPVGVDRLADIRFPRQERDPDNNGQQNDHAGTDKFFCCQAGCFQSQPHYYYGRYSKDQASKCGRDPQQLSQNFSAAAGIGDHAANGVGAHRNKDQYRPQFSHISFCQPRQLHGLFRAEGSLSHIQHGDRRKYPRDNKPHQQDRPSGLPGGISQS